MERDAGRLTRAALVLLVATGIGLVNAVDQYASGRAVPGGPAFGVWGVFWPHLLDTWVWAGLFPVAALLCRSFPLSSPRRRGTLAVHGLAAVLVILVAFVANFVVVRAVVLGGVHAGDFTGLPFRNTLLYGWRHHLISYGLVLSAAAGLEAGKRVRAEAARDAELRARLATARLETLRTQLHPHFLFNTLNGVLPLISDDPQAAVRTVGELSALLRESLSDGTPVSDVTGELRFLDRYLGLLKLRFGERLDYTLKVTPEAAHGVVPRLLLQPLVENAVQHGLARREEGGRVDVEARRSGDSLVLEVRDDGPELASVPDRASGVGLSNTRARLAAIHGDRCAMTLDPRAGGGVVARIVLPFEAMS